MPEYRTPGVYIEEISAGPRPVAAAPTTETGFVAILTLPTSFSPGRGKAEGMFLPAQEEQALLSWNRALAFRALLPAPAEAGGGDGGGSVAPAEGNRLKKLVQDILGDGWNVSAPQGDGNVTLKDTKGQTLRVPARRTLLSVKTNEGGQREWDLSWGADEQQAMELIAGQALGQGVKHTGNLGAVQPGGAPVTVDIAAIQERLQKTAPAVQSMEGYELWRRDLGRELFIEITLAGNPNIDQPKAEVAWDVLPTESKNAWDKWMRSHPGMQRLELALTGFFSNGGKTAFLSMAVQAHGAAGPAKRKFLEDSFDGVGAMAMIAAPGLGFPWQQAILEYAGPRGRGDLFAVLETPRYLTTRNPRGVNLTPFRWVDGSDPYEMAQLETVEKPQQSELRYAGYSADEILDRCVPRDDTGFGAAYGPWLVVDNPLSTSPADRYVIAPPSGHVAGVIAATDLKPGGGVHKAPANEQVMAVAELVTSISDKEQEALNTKGINIIRHRPGAGIRIWGARTIAADPLWMYVNVRRLFLFVERSVRDAIQWAVFLPNTPQTRSDLKGTIAAFLYRLWSQGMLDGKTWSEAFTVRCDNANNPDTDVRAGLLTVDVEIRPVYPAEFVRVRFRQSPMRSEVSEG